MKKILLPALAAGLTMILLLSFNCGPAGLQFSAIPERIQAVEGYASLRITANAGVSRTKFSFVFTLPHRGRIEVSDFLGRTIYQIFILPEAAYFVVPSRNLYWPSREEEIMEKFLGFRLSLEEAVRFLTGRWQDSSLPGHLSGWTFRRDQQGRVTSGERGDLFFVIEEFAANSRQMRSLAFTHSHSRGRLKILQLQYNPDVLPGVYSPEFLEDYMETTWEQIRALIDDAG